MIRIVTDLVPVAFHNIGAEIAGSYRVIHPHLQATVVGRKLFACVLEGAVGFKVSEEKAKRLLDDPRFAPFQPYGKSRMREWVQFSCATPGSLAQHEDVLLSAYEYVSGKGDQ